MVAPYHQVDQLQSLYNSNARNGLCNVAPYQIIIISANDLAILVIKATQFYIRSHFSSWKGLLSVNPINLLDTE